MTYVLQSPALSPSARYAAKMCYHPGVGVILVGGTVDGNAALHDGPTGGATAATYKWTGTTWVKLTLPTDAIAGFGGELVYNPTTGKSTFFTGFDTSEIRYVCEFDGTTWVNTNISLNSVWGCGCYDANRAASIYFCGFPTFNFFAWNGSAVTAMPSTGASPAGYGATMAFDPIRGRTILYGGSQGNETWAYDYNTANPSTSTWVQLTPATTPTTATALFMSAYWNPALGMIVLKTGDQSWGWDGTDWNHLSTDTVIGGGPFDQPNASIAYDAGSGSAVYFYGNNNGNPSTNNKTYTATYGVTRAASFIGTVTPSGEFDPHSAALLESITILPTASVPGGGAVQYTAIGNYADGSTADITAGCTWSSSNPDVLAIDSATGLASAGFGAGTATITAVHP